MQLPKERSAPASASSGNAAVRVAGSPALHPLRRPAARDLHRHEPGRRHRTSGLAWSLLVIATAAASPSSATAEPTADGRALFGRCSACHAVVAGQAGLGPSLYGVVGRRAASLPGYDYSPALRKSGLVWTAATLDQWLTKPQAMTPGTKMAFAGLSRAADREAVVAYLETLK